VIYGIEGEDTLLHANNVTQFMIKAVDRALREDSAFVPAIMDYYHDSPYDLSSGVVTGVYIQYDFHKRKYMCVHFDSEAGGDGDSHSTVYFDIRGALYHRMLRRINRAWMKRKEETPPEPTP